MMVVPTLFLMSLAGYNTQVLNPVAATQEAQYLQNSQQVTYGATQPFAGNTYNLAGSGISGSATTITLTSLTLKQTGQPIQTTDLVGTGGTFYVTLEPGSNTKQEIVGCTGVTQSGTTASLTGCTRGLSPISPYTASSTLQFGHAGGTQVIFSDPPQLFAQYANIASPQTITGLWNYTTTPTFANNPVNATDAVNYQTLLATAISGAGTSTENNMGIVRLATWAQSGTGVASSTSGQPLVIKNSTASSTYNGSTVFQGEIPALRSTKDIDPNFVATSSANLYNFLGTVNIASSTIGTSTQATTTVTGSFVYKGKSLSTPTFGGTGTDGTFAVSSGTTTIALGTANYYEKDYTSISITGTGSLNFSSAATSSSGVTVVLKSTSACTFTSSSQTMIDLRWLGGGLGTAFPSSNSNSIGGAGGGGGGSTAGQGGNGGNVNGGTNGQSYGGLGGVQLPALASSTNLALPGGNGTAGVAGSGAAGVGGLGAGGLYIECAGAYNFTTGGFMAVGANGGSGVGGGAGGGGGGGGGGNIFVRYGSLTANSGTYTTTAGSAGSPGSGGSAVAGASGAAGSHLEVVNTTNY